MLFLFLYGLSNLVSAQNLYWIYLDSKDTTGYKPSEHLSPECLKKRACLNVNPWQFTDIPLKKAYLNTLSSEGIKLRVQSKWLNATSAPLTTRQLEKVKRLPFVIKVVPFGPTQNPTALKTKNDVIKVNNKPSSFTFVPAKNPVKQYRFSPALEQINALEFIAQGLDGTGVLVGLIDAGFRGANKAASLSHLFINNRILGTRDKVMPGRPNFYEGGSGYNLDTHGATVLKNIAGLDTAEAIQMGCATGAQFFLARTDDNEHEFRGEEDYWLSAMEWMDSVGVRLINTSLGYGLGFDKMSENYKPTDMNGSSTAVVKATDIAVFEKKITVVGSAGNDGEKDEWKSYINSPADGKGIISVGATLGRPWLKAAYSGVGPEFLPWLKPDVACYSLTGTSFSAPAITGFVACLIQANPKLGPLEIKNILKQASNLYPYGNNYLGMGYPNAEKAIKLAQQPEKLVSDSAKTEVKLVTINKSDLEDNGDFKLKIKNTEQKLVVLFHKKDARTVISQDEIAIFKNHAIITRPKQAARTTVMVSEKVWEIIWPQ